MIELELNSSKLSSLKIFNFSYSQAALILEEHLTRDRIFEKNTEVLLITFYGMLMTTGIISNVLMSSVILHNKLHTSRNLFLINLSMSDITLCLFCMPFTAMELVRRHWPLGEFLCKLVPFVQGCTVFVSAATVSAIAIDRHKIITSVVPHKRREYEKRIAHVIGVIWLVSVLLSAPVCFSQTILQVGLPGIVIYRRCVERWPSFSSKGAYTVVILITQFVIPSTVLAVTHFHIKSHLNATLFQHGLGIQKNGDRLRKELSRNGRATMVLITITIAYAFSWLPWNIINLIADFHPSVLSAQSLYLAFAVCHLIAMTSATTNPILYGWLNTNIKKEMIKLGRKMTHKRRCPESNESNYGNGFQPLSVEFIQLQKRSYILRQ